MSIELIYLIGVVITFIIMLTLIINDKNSTIGTLWFALPVSIFSWVVVFGIGIGFISEMRIWKIKIHKTKD